MPYKTLYFCRLHFNFRLTKNSFLTVKIRNKTGEILVADISIPNALYKFMNVEAYKTLFKESETIKIRF